MVSIIIINYNTFELTKNCIESVRLKTTVPHEIILVDNHSTECPADEFKNLFPEIILIKSKVNCGFSKGNNLGIEVARGDYILLLNSDTILLNNAIDLAYNKLVSDNTIGVLSCQMLDEKGQIQKSNFRHGSIGNLLWSATRLYKLLPALKSANYDPNSEYEADWVLGAFFFFPKSILKIFPNQKLPETFFMYVEDEEWCYLIKKSGKKVLYFPDSKIAHFSGGSSSELSSQKWIYIRKNIFHFNYMQHGKWYAVMYSFADALNTTSIRNKDGFRRSIVIFKFTIKNMFNYSYEYSNVI